MFVAVVADAHWSTVDTGVANVESGHCLKTLAILRLALGDIDRLNRKQLCTPSTRRSDCIAWLLLTDDDTLLRYRPFNMQIISKYPSHLTLEGMLSTAWWQMLALDDRRDVISSHLYLLIETRVVQMYNCNRCTIVNSLNVCNMQILKLTDSQLFARTNSISAGVYYI